MFSREFELAATVCILGGAASVIPAALSGWLTWKKRYHGARTRIFHRKILIAIAMLVVSLPLAVWRVVLYYLGRNADGVDHYVFFIFCFFLVAGAVTKGSMGDGLRTNSSRFRSGFSPKHPLRVCRLVRLGSRPELFCRALLRTIFPRCADSPVSSRSARRLFFAKAATRRAGSGFLSRW